MAARREVPEPPGVLGVTRRTLPSRARRWGVFAVGEVRTGLRRVRGSVVPLLQSAMAAGLAWSASVVISRDFEISQFWQNLQARLQPAVPNENTLEPG